jgi:hypothetical protein
MDTMAINMKFGLILSLSMQSDGIKYSKSKIWHMTYFGNELDCREVLFHEISDSENSTQYKKDCT